MRSFYKDADVSQLVWDSRLGDGCSCENPDVGLGRRKQLVIVARRAGSAGYLGMNSSGAAATALAFIKASTAKFAGLTEEPERRPCVN